MRFRAILHTILLFILSHTLGAQATRARSYLELSAGNVYYVHPSSYTFGFSPQFNAIFMATAHEDSLGANVYYLGGLSYHHTEQVYRVFWSGSNINNAVTDHFHTNEFLFNLGGCIRYSLGKNVFASLSFVLQGGQNYTWTDDPAGSIVMGRVVYNGSCTTGFFSPGGGHYTMKYRTIPYKWSYLQFYAMPGANLILRLNKVISFLVQAAPRIYLGREYVGNDPGTVQFNYAPVKLDFRAGLLVKLFK